MNDYVFGNFIRQLREKQGLSQHQLGALVGVSNKAVSKWETGASIPQPHMLIRLGEVLGVTVDELLAGERSAARDKEQKDDISLRREVLWEKAEGIMRARYGPHLSLAVVSRISHEREMLENDAIRHFDLTARLVKAAREFGCYIAPDNEVGNYSFAAYLLGANPINSLPAHHFCPRCRRMAFSDGQDGWDLPVRRCECGVMMERDGHSLSIDICRHSQLNLSISCGNPAFRRRALEIMAECFPECVLPGSADIEKPFAVVCFAPAKSALPEGNLRRYFGLLPHVRFHPDDIGREIAELEHLTGTCFDRVDFLEDTVLERFFINHVENFPLYGAIFGGEFLRELIERFRPASCGEYMKLFALHYDSSVWRKAGMERLEEMLLHREDLYDLLAAGMRRKGYADNGFALTVTNNAGCGYYRQHGLDRETARFLAELELPDWVGKSLPHIGYLHSRADTLRELRICFILLWYQLHYPAEFAQVMKPDR